MAKLPPRVLGLALLACSGASTLVHRGVYEAAQHGPAQAAEFGLALLTFLLASAGLLLLVHGARLFAPVRRDRDARTVGSRSTLQTRFEAPITPAGRAFDTRRGVSMMQVRAGATVPGHPERTRRDGTSPPTR